MDFLSENSIPRNLLSCEFETDLYNPVFREVQWELARLGVGVGMRRCVLEENTLNSDHYFFSINFTFNRWLDY